MDCQVTGNRHNPGHPEVTIFGITGVGEIKPGDDLATLLVSAASTQGTPLAPRDILVITQKAVSKAEGRVLDLASIEPSPFARHVAAEYDKDPRLIEVVLRESKRIVRMDRGVMITETHRGFVCANAGVDKSNVPGAEVVTILPADPDASARRLRTAIRHLTHLDIAVIISDTFGRPWREGVVNFAIGVAGLNPLVDYRGTSDPHGNLLKVTQVAVADEIACAAELVTGKVDGIPAAIVRGYPYRAMIGGSELLKRNPARDMFR